MKANKFINKIGRNTPTQFFKNSLFVFSAIKFTIVLFEIPAVFYNDFFTIKKNSCYLFLTKFLLSVFASYIHLGTCKIRTKQAFNFFIFIYLFFLHFFIYAR